jgi:glycerol-3-phosphate acyltransferase PlsY
MMIVVFGFLSFCLGSIPNGYIIAKAFEGIDIREYGSKNIGATNVGRVIGWKYGFPVLLLDTLKGVIPVLTVRFFFHEWHNWEPLNVSLLLGGLAILGHVYTPFLNFKGGKGVATALGVCLSLVPVTTFGAIIVFFIVYRLSGFVSLGSIIGSISMPILYIVFISFWREGQLSFSILYSLIFLAVIITVAHRENLIRIIQGKELKAIMKRSPS